MNIERGDVWLCDFDQHPDSRQNGIRPALVVQTDLLNQVANYHLTIVVPFSTKGSERIPSHALIDPNDLNGLAMPSFAKCEQIQTIPQTRLIERKGKLAQSDMGRVDAAIRRTLAIG